MKISLLVLTPGKSEGKAIPIALAQFLIGRDPQCNLRPASPLISKRHCAILNKNGNLFVRDFNSTNGTFVNNEQVKEERALHNDDVLKVGPLEFKVVVEGSVPVNKPTPTPPPAKLSQGSNDDDVAAMLLSLQDDSSPAAAELSGDSDEVPGGTTLMDLLPQAPAETKDEIPKADEQEPDDKKPEASSREKKPEAKAAQANTSQAAKMILDKYSRRSRS